MSGVLTDYPVTTKTPYAGTVSSALTSALNSGTVFTHAAASSADFAIQDLTSSAGFGFATKDEGNTVLAVIANNFTRIGEIEAALESLGLVPSS